MLPADSKARPIESSVRISNPIRRQSANMSGIGITFDDAPCIPEGTYLAVGGDAAVIKRFGKETLAVSFLVSVPDPDSSADPRQVLLYRYYNVRSGPGRRLKVGAHSDLKRDWIRVAGRSPRADRMPASVFKGILMKVDVCTVKKDWRQQPLPEAARYSKVSRIVDVLTGA